MRLILAAALTLAFAGTAMAATTKPVHHAMKTKSHMTHAASRGTGQKPLDVGPNTPAANAAYQGGGVVLQGAPGAPAPTPAATPPGQTPANAVPPR